MHRRTLRLYGFNLILAAPVGLAGLVKLKGTAAEQSSPHIGSVLQAATVRAFEPIVAAATSMRIEPSAIAAEVAGTQAGPVSL